MRELTVPAPLPSHCSPMSLERAGFNERCELPYGLTVQEIRSAMQRFLGFLGSINTLLAGQEMDPLEALLMPANFSSIVGEFMVAGISRLSTALTKNRYHNGHPDLVPIGTYPGDAILHGTEGIEVKGSRYLRGWQGHNRENVWLMVFVFESSRPTDAAKGIPYIPFRFLKVVGARLVEDDWTPSGRSATSRRTPTASVAQSGFQKMEANWVYRATTGSAVSDPEQPEPFQESDESITDAPPP